MLHKKTPITNVYKICLPNEKKPRKITNKKEIFFIELGQSK